MPMMQTDVKGCPLELRGLYQVQNQRQKRLRIIFLAVLGMLIAACTTARAQTDQVPNAWGEPVDGLQIAIYFDPSKTQNPRPDDVMLALKNVGTTEITVTLGGGCGDYSPTADVVLFLTDSEGKSQKLDDISGPGFCAGVAAVVSVSLAPGAVHTTPLNLYRYFGRVPHPANSTPLPAGTYTVQAGLLDWPRRPNEPMNERFVAHLKSNKLRVEF